VLSWAQGAKTDLFDVNKLQQELEIMKGILGTTLNFVTRDHGRGSNVTPEARAVYALGGTSRSFFGYSRITAFYLYGQGAVFVVPSSGLRLSQSGGGLAMGSAGYEHALGAYYLDAAALADTVRVYSSAVAAQAAAQTPVPKAAVAPVPAQVNQEELRKAQEKVRKSQEDLEARRAKVAEALAQVKGYLIEALANHGDSMTTVKPGEYLTVVLVTEDFDMGLLDSGARARQEIISVQKSWITDYKAGRITLDAFKQKALQYSE
jgi:hypothetical protein